MTNELNRGRQAEAIEGDRHIDYALVRKGRTVFWLKLNEIYGGPFS